MHVSMQVCTHSRGRTGQDTVRKLGVAAMLADVTTIRCTHTFDTDKGNIRPRNTHMSNGAACSAGNPMHPRTVHVLCSC